MPRRKATLYFRGGILYCGLCDTKMSDKNHKRDFCLAEPSPGRGHIRTRDIPLVLTEGLTSNPTGHMTRRCDMSSPAKRKAIAHMEARHPGYAKVYWSHQGGMPLRDVAAKLGITVANAKKRNQRAQKFLDEREAAYDSAA